MNAYDLSLNVPAKPTKATKITINELKMWPNFRLTQIWPFGFIFFILIGVLTAISQGIIEKILTSKLFFFRNIVFFVM